MMRLSVHQVSSMVFETLCLPVDCCKGSGNLRCGPGPLGVSANSIIDAVGQAVSQVISGIIARTGRGGVIVGVVWTPPQVLVPETAGERCNRGCGNTGSGHQGSHSRERYEPPEATQAFKDQDNDVGSVIGLHARDSPCHDGNPDNGPCDLDQMISVTAERWAGIKVRTVQKEKERPSPSWRVLACRSKAAVRCAGLRATGLRHMLRER